MYLHFLVLLLCALYGSVFTFGKVALNYAPPLFITAARMILAALLLLLYQYVFNRRHFTFKLKQVWPLAGIGLTNVYLTNALEFWGLQFMETGKACFICSFSPIATALISYFWFSEKITLKKWMGLGLGVLGFIPILIAHSASEAKTGYLGFLSYAELAILGAAVLSALGWIIMRSLVKQGGYSGVMSNALSMLIGGGFSLVHSFCVEEWSPSPISDFWPFLESFLGLMLVSNIICYNLHALLLKSYTATYLSFAGLSQSFFTAVFGWLFLNEIMAIHFWISMVVVIVGLYLYYQEELKLGYLHRQFQSIN